MINYLAPNFTDIPGRRAIPRNYKKETSAVDHIDVSIVTPYYNTEELFVETFVSLLAQSLQNWEWVIVDDGSHGPGICESPCRHRGKRRSHQDHSDKKMPGQAQHAIRAFRQSQSGRYICLLDHDDMIEPTYLEKCVWFLDSNPEFAFCNSYSVVFGDQEFLWTTGFERGKAFLQANSGPPISVIRRTAYQECGGFDASIRVLL